MHGRLHGGQHRRQEPVRPPLHEGIRAFSRILWTRTLSVSHPFRRKTRNGWGTRVYGKSENTLVERLRSRSRGRIGIPTSGVRFCLFGFDGFFDLHVIKLFRIEDFATFQALDKLNVLVPGDDTHSRVFADSRHVGSLCVGPFDLYFLHLELLVRPVFLNVDLVDPPIPELGLDWCRRKVIKPQGHPLAPEKVNGPDPDWRGGRHLSRQTSSVLLAPDCNHLQAKRKPVFVEFFPVGHMSRGESGVCPVCPYVPPKDPLIAIRLR